MRALVEAYGCTLNMGEAREIEELLTASGWEIVHSAGECDLAVLATCVVIEKTERAMVKRIRGLADVPKLVITGCMASACLDKAASVAPNASFVAPGDLRAFSEVVGLNASASSRRAAESRPYSIVPIASGCLGACSYCMTKLARGQLRSRPQSSIVESIRRMASNGPREIQLAAQDTACYGSDIGTDLPSLVNEIGSLPMDFRLRIGMMNPGSARPIIDGLSKAYRHPKVFKFLHMPVQSGSDKILECMNRGYSVADFKSIVSRIRSDVPGTTISTDLIVGYPGESPEDHNMNLKLISEVKPDIVNVTRFSSRPGTAAVGQGPPVAGWMAKERSREITRLRFAVALEKNRSWIGRTVRALATEPGKSSSTILRTDEYKQVVVREQLKLGDYYEVGIERATPTYLVGKRR